MVLEVIMTKKEILRLVAFLFGTVQGLGFMILRRSKSASGSPWPTLILGMAFLLLGVSSVFDPPLYYAVHNIRDQVNPLIRVGTKISAVLSLIVGTLILLTSCWGLIFYR
jgi:hypothetical protein